MAQAVFAQVPWLSGFVAVPHHSAMMTTTPAAVTSGGQATIGRAGKEEATQAQDQAGAELKMLGAAGESQDDGKKMATNIEFKSIYMEMNSYGEANRQTTVPYPGTVGNFEGFALPPFSSQNPLVPVQYENTQYPNTYEICAQRGPPIFSPLRLRRLPLTRRLKMKLF